MVILNYSTTFSVVVDYCTFVKANSTKNTCSSYDLFSDIINTVFPGWVLSIMIPRNLVCSTHCSISLFNFRLECFFQFPSMRFENNEMLFFFTLRISLFSISHSWI